MINDRLTNDILAKEKMTWLWIKQRLYLQESSLLKLAQNHNVKKQIFSRVKHFPIPKYERIIADAVGLDPWDLWPHRYDEEYNPNRISWRYPEHKKLLASKSQIINRKN